MNTKVLTADEVKELICDDDFVWVELRHGNYGVLEDETFNLRACLVTNFAIDFSTPSCLIHCEIEDYGKSWRVWNVCPYWENSEIWNR